MKFSNGCWLQTSGTHAFGPKEVYDLTIKKNYLKLVMPTSKINHRGDTLGGILLTLIVTSPAENVLRLTVHHNMGIKAVEPNFEINISQEHAMSISDNEELVICKTGNLSLEINKNDGSFIYRRNGVEISRSNGQDLAYMRTNFTGIAYDAPNEQNAFMRQQLSIGVGEYFYGFGEKFTPFIKNGQTIECWNEDGGTSTEQAYKNIPFCISNQGYGLFVNHPEKVSYEIGSEQVSKIQFSVPGEKLDYFFIDGPTMKDVLRRYTDLTGKPGLPAPWTYGLWLSTSFTTNYDEETVMSFINGMHDRGIPLSVFHFDCFWMKDFHWSNFIWDERVFPDPKGMLQRLHDKGLKVCVWINPYIAQESELFAEGMEKGYFIKKNNGDVWQWDMWQPGMAIVDFTNPAAKAWYQEKLAVLVDLGVDCFKTDFGERIPSEDIVYYNQAHPVKMHNYYTYLYNEAVYELLVAKKGQQDAVLFARSATAGGQKFPVHWGGDCWSNYTSMAESLRGGLSLTMSGFGFWSHDIGGFESTSTADVYKRWVAFGLLSTHSRLHGSTSYRVPWLYDEEAVDVLREFTNLKHSLLHYYFSQSVMTAKTGIPMMRSMVLEFEKDPTCAFLDRQYMLGDSLLVAPIFNEQGEGKFYLPKGKWTDYFTNEIYNGQTWHSKLYDYHQVPLLVRENTLLPLIDETTEIANWQSAALEVRAYEIADQTLILFDENQNEIVNLSVKRVGDALVIKYQGTLQLNLRIMNQKAKVDSNIQNLTDGTLISNLPAELQVELEGCE